jgi:hypothetical protein
LISSSGCLVNLLILGFLRLVTVSFWSVPGQCHRKPKGVHGWSSGSSNCRSWVGRGHRGQGDCSAWEIFLEDTPVLFCLVCFGDVCCFVIYMCL